MKNLFRRLGLLLGVVLLAGVGFLLFVQVRGIPTYAPPRPVVADLASTPARVALGEKLTLSICGDCHLNPATNRYAGHHLADLTPDFGRIYTSNITQDAQPGIGRWTDQQLVGLLRTGLGPDGRLRLIMPNYARMSDEDLASIVAFLRSASPQVQPDPTSTPPQEPSLLLLKLLGNTIMRPARLPVAPAGLEQMFELLSVSAERNELPPLPTGPPSPEILQRIGEVQRGLGIEMQQARIFGH